MKMAGRLLKLLLVNMQSHQRELKILEQFRLCRITIQTHWQPIGQDKKGINQTNEATQKTGVQYKLAQTEITGKRLYQPLS